VPTNLEPSALGALELQLPDRHLDIGCGKFPRNPYGRSELCGVDIRPLTSNEQFDYRVANLTLHTIPWPDSHFGSVSAFDFIEHVPRVLATPDGRETFFPFIRVMNEIWRVLAPGGLCYALTPGWPHEPAMRDPTHVNFITEHTHEYFCGSNPLGRMYGFRGEFEARRVKWVEYNSEYIAPETREPTLREQWKRLKAELRGRASYLLWELRSIKTPEPTARAHEAPPSVGAES
jgi:SAM-dependent methyltransferase